MSCVANVTALIFTFSAFVSLLTFKTADYDLNESEGSSIFWSFNVMLCIIWNLWDLKRQQEAVQSEFGGAVGGGNPNDFNSSPMHSIHSINEGDKEIELRAASGVSADRIGVDSQQSSSKYSLSNEGNSYFGVLTFRRFQSVLLLVLTINTGLGAIVLSSNASNFSPAGRLFDIGNTGYKEGIYRKRRMHMICEGPIGGADLPVVLFEHGWQGSSLDWSLPFYELKAYTRVCAYDRAGYGWSDRGPLPRTSEQMMRETELMLDEAESYVWGEGGRGDRKMLLVGHSMAGFQMRIFQDRNPELVSGIVFADAVNPDFIDAPGFGNRFDYDFFYTFGANFLAPSGLMPVLTSMNKRIVAGGAGIPEDAPVNRQYNDVQERYSYITSKTRWFETAKEEWQSWPENAARTAECGSNKDGKLGDLPIYVFAAKDSVAFNFYTEPLALEELSTNSTSEIVEGAKHGFIFDYRFTDIFVDAVLGMLGLKK